MPNPMPEGDRLLTETERLRVVAEANYQIEPLLHVLKRLADEESEHLRYFCIAVMPRLQQLTYAAQAASCEECFKSEIQHFEVPGVD